MAIIPLRQYNREIEGMIDSGQIDEAVAHCRHILQTYPKHIQTYRLLGKTFLESQRYTDASDIFQRLLTVVPDDFVSHVGMSIIREDENNLDTAIWHMERAFETQPSNAAIQEELRRLYGRRDGIEPPKIRLTRGALARMYARGNLYEQAIAELRAALSEDPQRADLNVLLAQMYYHGGHRLELIDVCNSLLKKFPHCLEANRLLVVTLPETNRADDTGIYRQHLIALDPYYAHTAPAALSADDVPENAVNIERLTYRPGQSVSGAPEQPAWASSLGVAFEKESSEQLPEWLQEEEPAALVSGQERQPTESAPFSWESPEEMSENPLEKPAEEDAIPDWMKEAGWQSATGEAGEEPATFDMQDAEAEITKGEIPEWLKGMAPEGILDEELPPLPEEDSETVLPWLQEKEPGPTDTIITWLEEAKLQEKPEAETEIAPEPDQEPLPDWLQEEKPSQTSEPTSEQAQVPDEEQLPTWLADLDQAKEKPSGITDWLQSSSLPPEPTLPAEPGPSEQISSIPPDLADQDAALAWLESLAVQHGAKEEELITRPEDRLEVPPDWVQDQVPAEEQLSVPGVEESAISIAEETAEQDQAPDWLQDFTPVETTQPTTSGEIAQPIDKTQEAELPDWLREMTPIEDTAPTPEEPFTRSNLAEDGEVPEWLRSMAPDEDATPTPATEESAPFENVEEGELPDWIRAMSPGEEELPAAEPEGAELFEAAEEAGLPAWLSELETDQDNIPASPEETPSEFTQEFQDWSIEGQSEQLDLEPEGKLPVEPLPADEVPDWLKEMTIDETTPEALSETPIEPVTEGEIPDWLKEMAPAEAEQELPVEAPSESAPTEEFPSWLEEMASEEAEAEIAEEHIAETAQPEELPSWIHEMDTSISEVSAPAESLTAPAVPDLTDQDAALAWLESLAVQHGAKEEELITRPEDRLEAPPDWVQESVVAETPTEEPTPELAAEEAELPVWIEEAEAVAAIEMQEEAEIPEEPLPPAEELPAWLQEMKVEEAVPEQAEGTPTEPEPSEEVPAWLQEMAPEEFAPESVEEPSAKAEPSAEIPAWLKEMATEEIAPESFEEPSAKPELAEEVPTWLEETTREEALPEPISEAPIEPAPAEEIPAWILEEPQTVTPAEQIDINSASLSELERLPGVGFILAQNILTQREVRGGFKNLEELSSIPGVSSDLIDSIRGMVKVAAVEAVPVPSFAEDDEALLADARKEMDAGQSATAVTKYSHLVKKSHRLDTIIHELQEALYRFPVDIDLWQTLGDAYMRNDNLEEALDAYTKAEELLR